VNSKIHEIKIPINKMSRDEIEKESSNKKKQIVIKRIRTKSDTKIK
jgi:hypothetical protein